MDFNDIKFKGKDENFAQLKGGIRRESIKDQNLLNIFDSVDTDRNHVLDKNEINIFQQKVIDAAKHGRDSKLSKNEADNYMNGESLNGGHSTLFSFMNTLSRESKNIKSTKTNNDGSITTEYNDGTIETINGDTKEVKQGSTTKKYKLNPKTNEYEIQEETIVDTTDGSETVTIYKNGKKSGCTKTYPNGNKEEVQYDDSGENPLSKTVTKDNGKTEETYEYSNGNFLLKTKIENKGEENQKITTYSKNSDNSTTETIEDNTGKREITKSTNKTIEIYTDKNGKVTKTTTENVDGKTVVTVADEKGETTKITEKLENGNKLETIIDNDNNQTKTITNQSGYRVKQSKFNVKTNKTYTVEYDGAGNTSGVVVQYGENAQILAKKFGCSTDDLLALNGKQKGENFRAGEKIKVPQELEADDKKLVNRKSSEEVKAIVKRKEEQRARILAARQKRQAETQMLKEEYGLINREGEGKEVVAYYSGRKTSKTLKMVGKATNGRTICTDGKQYYVVSHDKLILKMDYVKNPEKYLNAIKHNENVKKRKVATNLAQQFYQIADDNSGLNSMEKMQQLLNQKVNKDNIVEFLDSYDKARHGDSSIIDTVTSEVGASGTKQQKQVLMTILKELIEAANAAGVSKQDIQKAKKDFEASYEKEYSAVFRRTNPKDMEKAIDFLRGAIAAKRTANVESMSDANAIKNFNQNFQADNDAAQAAYNDAKGKDGWSWSAKAGDTVCGWFGCNTIGEMEAKLGNNAAAVKSLATAKSEAEFKQRYKQVFGIEFDAQKIAASDAAQSNLAIARSLSQAIGTYNSLIKNADNQTLQQLENKIKSTLQFDNDNFQKMKQQVYASATTDADKKKALIQYLNSAKEELSTQYYGLAKGRTLAQMEKDAELVTKSAFGTNDIGKDVAQFTENMQTTEMVTDIAGDIALTVALSFIPGAGAAGAARLAATAAKWGTKGIKVAKALKKTAVALNHVKKFEQGTRYVAKTRKGRFVAKTANFTTRTISSTGNAVAGTAIYESIATNHTKEEIIEKCKTNGIYGAIGSGASVLAPKLMQLFPVLKNNTLATEVAEEIINAVGALSYETAKGGEYGSQDAVMDIVSGILMARLSHIGNGRVKANEIPEQHPNKTQNHPTGDKPKYIVPENETTFDKATRNGNNPNEVAPARSVGKLNDEKFKQAKLDVEAKLAEIKLLTDDNLVKLQKQIDALQDREQRRTLEAMLNKKKMELANNATINPKPEPKPIDESKPVVNDNDTKLKQKLGEQLHKLYVQIDTLIEKAKSIYDLTNLRTTIREKFANYKTEMNTLLDKLQTKWNALIESSKSTPNINNPVNNPIKHIDNNMSEEHIIKVDKDEIYTPLLNKKLSYPEILSSQKPQNLVHGKKYYINPSKNLNTQFSLGFGVANLDVNDKLFLQKFAALKEGESFTVGSWEGNADYKIGSMQLGVSREHFTVIKENGQMVIVDKKSTNGTKIQNNTHSYFTMAQIKPYFANNCITNKLSPVNSNIANFEGLTLDAIDYKNIEKLMNACNGRYINTWLSTSGTDGVQNIQKLALLEKVLRKTGAIDDYMELGPNEWDLVVNTTCQKDNTAINAISTYKNNSQHINKSLSGLDYMDATVGDQINKLTAFLNTQTINKKVKLHRGDSYNGVNYITTKDGKPLGEEMEKLIATGASKEKIDRFIADNLQGLSIKQERFMSTTLSQKIAKDWAKKDVCGQGYNPNGCICWDIFAPAGTKGAHVEDFSPYPMKENEVLLQRNSSLDIMGAHYNPEENIWIIQAIIRQ